MFAFVPVSYAIFVFCILNSGEQRDGLAINASVAKMSHARNDNLTVFFGFTKANAPWLVNHFEQFNIDYYNNDKKLIKTSGSAVAVGELRPGEMRVFSLPCERPLGACWVRVEFGISGLKTPFVRLP